MKSSKLIFISLWILLFSFSACDDDSTNVTGIALDNYELNLAPGQTAQLKATVSPADADNQAIDWSSSDETIAGVSNGLVSAESIGTAEIQAKTSDGGFTATCTVIVSEAGGSGGTIENLTGSLGVSTTSDCGIEITVDANGIPYIALNAYDAALAPENRNMVQVWKYTGSAWQQFGEDIGTGHYFSGLHSVTPGLIFAPNGELYVSYFLYDENASYHQQLLVKKSSGGTWDMVGDPIQNGGDNLGPRSELGVKEDGTILLTSNYGYDAYCRYWTGTAWESYNDYRLNPDNLSVYGTEIKCVGNVPYICIRNYANEMGVLMGSETNGLTGPWEWVGSLATGNASGIPEYTNESPFAIHSSGDIYVTFKELEGIEHYANVKRFPAGGSSWEYMGQNTVNEGNFNKTDIVISDDMVYLLVGLYDGPIKVYRLYTEANTWVYECETSDIDVYYTFDTVAGQDGEFFIATEGRENHDGEIQVYRYTPPAE